MPPPRGMLDDSPAAEAATAVTVPAETEASAETAEIGTAEGNNKAADKDGDRVADKAVNSEADNP